MLKVLCLISCLCSVPELTAQDTQPKTITVSLNEALRNKLGKERVSLAVDPALPPWQPQLAQDPAVILHGVRFSLGGYIQLWQAITLKRFPDATFELPPKTSPLIPALMNGRGNMGIMSRRPRLKELQTFHQRYPKDRLVVLPYALDALTMYVHPKVGVDRLDLEQIRGIYTAEGGQVAKVRNWLQLGGQDMEIVAAVQSSSNVAYGYFRRYLLDQKDYAPNLLHSPKGSSWYPLHVVASTFGGIGFGPIAVTEFGITNDQVAPLALIDPATKQELVPSVVNIFDGTYPLGQPLFIVLIANEQGQIPPATADFLRMVYSQEGQTAIAQSNLIPLPEILAHEARQLIDRLAPPSHGTKSSETRR